MELKAKVINRFKEKEHDGHIYEVNDSYPFGNFKADEKRVEFLTQNHPKYKKVYLEVDEESEFPKHTGGGYYELSNGEKVKGKDEAKEAEKALKSGD